MEKILEGVNLKNLNWLKNKSVVVVGASDGVGKCLVFKLMLQYNCKIIGISNNQKQMVELYEKLEEYKDNFNYHVFDACNEKKWEEFLQSLKDSKTNVDVLINCVGDLPKFNHFYKYTQKDLIKSMDANFYSAVFSIRHLLPILKDSKEPAIINISCLATSLHAEGTSAYSASKAALKSYTQVLSSELDNKIYVSLVLLGIVKSDFYKNQDLQISNKILEKAMSPRIASKIILDGICKKKKRIVVGVKTLVFDYVTRMFPSKSILWIKKWLKHKKINLINMEESSEN